MNSASFRFYHGLDELLAKELRGEWVVRSFKGNPSIKHMVESLQIPHTEIGPVMVNGLKAGLGTLLYGGEKVELFPAIHELTEDVSASDWPPRFLLDGHLGKLATYLRMLGVDARYSNKADDKDLAQAAEQDHLALLTRDRRLLMRKMVTRGYLVRSLDPICQLEEVIQRFKLEDQINPFVRCLRCNTALLPVDKQAVYDRLEPLTKQYYNDFSICPMCGRVYWRGSHHGHMQAIIQQIRGEHR
jgi:hypothetical protein